MKRRVIRVGVLIAAVAVLMVPVPPATATTAKAVVIVGSITLSSCPGHGDPFTTGTPNVVPGVKSGPKGEPQVNLNPGGTVCSFSLASTLCVKSSVGKKVGPADFCLLTAAGTISGFCGFSTGTGVIAFANLSSSKEVVTTAFKFTNVRGVWNFSGGGAATNFYLEVFSVVTAGSCENGTATSFTMHGEGAYKDITT